MSLFAHRLILASLLCAPAIACAAPVLERVVIVERHGVRSPTKPPEALSKFSAEAWPAWPVPPGELTPHGAASLKLMGAWVRTHYAGLGLLPAAGCPEPGHVFAWTDGHDDRTRESGDAVLAGIAPGCGLVAAHAPQTQQDPVFDGISAGGCALDPAVAKQAVEAALVHGLADPVPGYAPSLAALRELLSPAATRKPCAGAADACFEDGENTLTVSAGGAKIKGPLATSSTLTEALALEYEEGMTGQALGWGRLDPALLTQIMTLHNGYSHLTRGNPAIAGANAAILALTVLDAIDGKPAFPAESGHAAKLTIILGHDTTLANLGGLLGVRWTLPGQPDETPPGGALVFEVYAGGLVRVSMLYQTADQIRTLAAGEPGRVALSPACGTAQGAACTVGSLRQLVEAAVPEACRVK